MIHSKKEDRGNTEQQFTNLYVQNLPENFTDAQLKDAFKEYGEIQSVSVNQNKKGSGFVNFASHDEAKNALASSNMKQEVEGKKLIVSPHIYRKESELKPKAGSFNPIVQNQKSVFKSNIFVKFLPNDVTEEILREKFKEAGEITSIKMKKHNSTMNGETISNYQIAYVLYADVQSAQRCIKLFDYNMVFGQRPLRVDFWQSQDDLRQQHIDRSHEQLYELVNLARK